jgi:hypothetical protein
MGNHFAPTSRPATAEEQRHAEREQRQSYIEDIASLRELAANRDTSPADRDHIHQQIAQIEILLNIH